MLLPIGIALGGVHYQHVHTGLHQGGNPLGIVPGVDARTHHIAFLAIQQFQGIALVGIVILTEHKAHQMSVCCQDRQGVELVIPDDVIGGFQASALRSGNDLFRWGHECFHLGRGVHPADPVVPACDQAQELPCAGTVVGDGHRGVAGALFQRQHIR